MSDHTIPKVIADYLQTVHGRMMLDSAVWFRWSLDRRLVEATGNTPPAPPEQMAVPGQMVFVRDGSGWKRYA